jgi:hypothetical protein
VHGSLSRRDTESEPDCVRRHNPSTPPPGVTRGGRRPIRAVQPRRRGPDSPRAASSPHKRSTTSTGSGPPHRRSGHPPPKDASSLTRARLAEGMNRVELGRRLGDAPLEIRPNGESRSTRSWWSPRLQDPARRPRRAFATGKDHGRRIGTVSAAAATGRVSTAKASCATGSQSPTCSSLRPVHRTHRRANGTPEPARPDRR